MIRTGCIVSLTGDIAEVQLDPLSCSRCEKGEGCAIRLLSSKPAPEIGDHTLIHCANAVQAKPGDRVEISLDVSFFNKVRVNGAYLLPVIGLLAGAISGTLLAGLVSTDSQLLPSLGAIVGFAGGLFAYPSYNCEQHAADLQGLNPRISRLLVGESTIAFRATTSADS